MNIQPNSTVTTPCPACGSTSSHLRVTREIRSCTQECTRAKANEFIDTSSYVAHVPHLHVRCSVCRFEWLIEVEDPVRFQKLW